MGRGQRGGGKDLKKIEGKKTLSRKHLGLGRFHAVQPKGYSEGSRAGRLTGRGFSYAVHPNPERRGKLQILGLSKERKKSSQLIWVGRQVGKVTKKEKRGRNERQAKKRKKGLCMESGNL